MKMRTSIFAAMALAGLAACDRAEKAPGETPTSEPETNQTSTAASAAPPTAGPQTIDDESEAEAFAGISPSETVRFTGTEPFWGGQVVGTALTYMTPENQEGTDIAVTRFAGRGGVSWSGIYQASKFVLAVTPGQCSDGMSDRTYPFVATLEVAGEQRSGCAWTERQSYTGPANP